jgi:anti-sigma B factor antagonist
VAEAESNVVEHVVSFWRSDRPEAPCLMAKGEIDFGSENDFRDALADVLLDAEQRAVIDLTCVTFFGSAGIESLIDSGVLAEDRGVRLIVEPSELVRRVLEMVALAEEFAPHGNG